jgi:hypothetical protein
MNRQLVRQRPPADDDLQTETDEDLQKRHHAGAGTMKEPQVSPQARKLAREDMTSGAGPHAVDRSAYFTGRYSPDGRGSSVMARKVPDEIVDRRMLEFNVPGSLRHCVWELIHALREHGLNAALAALHNDPAIDRRYEGPVRSLLAAIDRDDRQTRP